MYSDDKYWIAFWSLAAVVVCTLIITLGINNYHNDDLVASAKTCEQAVIVSNEGDSQGIATKIMACRGNILKLVTNN